MSQNNKVKDTYDRLDGATNGIIKTKFDGEKDSHVLFLLPTIQLSEFLGDDGNYLLAAAMANTCRTFSAWDGFENNNNEFVKQFELDVNRILDTIPKDKENDETTKKIKDTLEKTVKILKNSNTDTVFTNKKIGLIEMSRKSNKNDFMALNFSGYKDDDGVGTDRSNEANLIYRFTKDTGIELKFKNSVKPNSRGEVLPTWVDTNDIQNLIEKTAIIYMCNGIYINPDDLRCDSKNPIRFYRTYLIQSIMHALSMRSEDFSVADRKLMLNNFLTLLADIKSGHCSGMKLDCDVSNAKDESEKMNIMNKAFTKAIFNRICDGLELTKEETDNYVDRVLKISDHISGADHVSQVLMYNFDMRHRVLKDGFIGRKNFLYVSLVDALEDVVQYYEQKNHGHIYDEYLDEVKANIEELKKIENNVWWRPVRDDAKKNAKEDKFNMSETQKINNPNAGKPGDMKRCRVDGTIVGYERTTSYDCDVTVDDLEKNQEQLAPVAENFNINETESGNIPDGDEDTVYTGIDRALKYLKAGNKLTKEQIQNINFFALLNMREKSFEVYEMLYRVYFEDILHGNNRLMQLSFMSSAPNSCFDKIRKKIGDMTAGQQAMLLTHGNNSNDKRIGRSQVIGKDIKYIKPEALKLLSKHYSLFLNELVSQCANYLTKKQIAVLDFLKLDRCALENLLMLKFDSIDNESFKKIDLSVIRNIGVLEKLLSSKLDFLNIEQIKEIDPKVFVKLPLVIVNRVLEKEEEKLKLDENLVQSFSIANLERKVASDDDKKQFDTFISKYLDILSDKQLLSIDINAIDDENLRNRIINRAEGMFANDNVLKNIFELNKSLQTEMVDVLLRVDNVVLERIFNNCDMFIGLIERIFKEVDVQKKELINKLKDFVSYLPPNSISVDSSNKMIRFFVKNMSDEQILSLDLTDLEFEDFKRLVEVAGSKLTDSQVRQIFALADEKNIGKILFLHKFCSNLGKKAEDQERKEAAEWERINKLEEQKNKIENKYSNEYKTFEPRYNNLTKDSTLSLLEDVGIKTTGIIERDLSNYFKKAKGKQKEGDLCKSFVRMKMDMDTMDENRYSNYMCKRDENYNKIVDDIDKIKIGLESVKLSNDFYRYKNLFYDYTKLINIANLKLIQGSKLPDDYVEFLNSAALTEQQRSNLALFVDNEGNIPDFVLKSLKYIVESFKKLVTKNLGRTEKSLYLPKLLFPLENFKVKPNTDFRKLFNNINLDAISYNIKIPKANLRRIEAGSPDAQSDEYKEELKKFRMAEDEYSDYLSMLDYDIWGNIDFECKTNNKKIGLSFVDDRCMNLHSFVWMLDSLRRKYINSEDIRNNVEENITKVINRMKKTTEITQKTINKNKKVEKIQKKINSRNFVYLEVLRRYCIVLKLRANDDLTKKFVDIAKQKLDSELDQLIGTILTDFFGHDHDKELSFDDFKGLIERYPSITSNIPILKCVLDRAATPLFDVKDSFSWFVKKCPELSSLVMDKQFDPELPRLVLKKFGNCKMSALEFTIFMEHFLPFSSPQTKEHFEVLETALNKIDKTRGVKTSPAAESLLSVFKRESNTFKEAVSFYGKFIDICSDDLKFDIRALKLLKESFASIKNYEQLNQNELDELIIKMLNKFGKSFVEHDKKAALDGVALMYPNSKISLSAFKKLVDLGVVDVELLGKQHFKDDASFKEAIEYYEATRSKLLELEFGKLASSLKGSGFNMNRGFYLENFVYNMFGSQSNGNIDPNSFYFMKGLRATSSCEKQHEFYSLLDTIAKTDVKKYNIEDQNLIKDIMGLIINETIKSEHLTDSERLRALAFVLDAIDKNKMNIDEWALEKIIKYAGSCSAKSDNQYVTSAVLNRVKNMYKRGDDFFKLYVAAAGMANEKDVLLKEIFSRNEQILSGQKLTKTPYENVSERYNIKVECKGGMVIIDDKKGEPCDREATEASIKKFEYNINMVKSYDEKKSQNQKFKLEDDRVFWPQPPKVIDSGATEFKFEKPAAAGPAMQNLKLMYKLESDKDYKEYDIENPPKINIEGTKIVYFKIDGGDLYEDVVKEVDITELQKQKPFGILGKGKDSTGVLSKIKAEEKKLESKKDKSNNLDDVE